jgi:hypothetical protein
MTSCVRKLEGVESLAKIDVLMLLDSESGDRAYQAEASLKFEGRLSCTCHENGQCEGISAAECNKQLSYVLLDRNSDSDVLKGNRKSR